jgi:hypothetical protein
MKRLIAALAAAAMLVAVAAVPVVANSGSDHHPGSGKAGPTQTLHLKLGSRGTGTQAVVKVVANLRKLSRSARSDTYTATAVMHFSDGDVTVSLKRHGRSLEWKGSAPVSAGNAANPVPVDVTITGTSATYSASGKARLRVAPSGSPHPKASTHPICPPSASPTPTPTPVG